ncbi:hypothetical protein [Xenorhabdus aichiensis]|nr:hypothetical protein [Xenorhabdus aichiensis]
MEMLKRMAEHVLLERFEQLDKIRMLENGKDKFSLIFTAKKYNDTVFIEKNVSLLDLYLTDKSECP